MSATTQPKPANANEIVNAALTLSPDERAMVAHTLLDSLDEPLDDPEEVKLAWKEEIARRIADYEAGRIKTPFVGRVFCDPPTAPREAARGMNLRLSDPALDDADEIEVRLESQSIGLGEEFAEELRKAIVAIAAHPRLHSPTDDGPANLETREYFSDALGFG